ncbi:MAG: diaminopimelate epimerase [Acidimicrobiia bacterium]
MTAFTKMEGLGNDFIVLEGPKDLDPSEVAFWSDRRRGIGADGVLVVTPKNGRISMEVFNADGSRAELSGNGLRCAARYAADRELAPAAGLVVETLAGSHQVARLASGEYRAELGRVKLTGERQLAGRIVHTASIGNPHAVVLVGDPEEEDVAVVGPEIASEFEGGVNVGFLAVERHDRLRLRVYERGAGETLACGTGAAAAHALAVDRDMADSPAVVSLRGGDLIVEIDAGTTWITGPARYVFEGSWGLR